MGPVQPASSRQGLQEAYDDAARTASRTSMLGALGFGIALLVGVRLSAEGGFLTQGFGLDMILLAGGIGGGLVFTALALRAARVAKLCRRRLDRPEGERES